MARLPLVAWYYWDLYAVSHFILGEINFMLMKLADDPKSEEISETWKDRNIVIIPLGD